MSAMVPPQFASFVQGVISSGQYESETDVMVAALTLLQQEQSKTGSIRQLLQPAFDELDRGEGIEVPYDKIDDFFDEIIREADDELQARQRPA